MSAKMGPLNQHDYLHPFYGEDNCCLCKAESRIQELERKVAELTEKLSSRPPTCPSSNLDFIKIIVKGA